jgi:hypothetical protein
MVDLPPVAVVEIDSLVFDDSPRIAGENHEHTRHIAELNTALPPIAVHRPTMRVIDGMHRALAARLNGERVILARFYDCAEETAFVHAVTANLTNGLPLSHEDRKAAAARIIATHPTWSDGAVASVTGLSDKSVRAVRRRSTPEPPESDSRLGRDGRVRPLNSAAKRRHAAELVRANPGAGLRAIAREAGISVATAADVRERLRRAEDPVPLKYRTTRAAPTAALPNGAAPVRDRTTRPPDPLAALAGLRNDPSLKFTDSGRQVLRWLHRHTVDQDDRARVLAALPAHCTNLVAEFARGCARGWAELADELERRPDPPGGPLTISPPHRR